MVNLRGKGSMSGKNLLVVAYDNSLGKGKDGNLNFLDVQVDHRDPAGPGQSNLHAASKIAKDKEGKEIVRENGTKLYDHNVNYYAKQFEAIKEAAGPNVEPLLDKDGKAVGTVYAVKGNLMNNPRGPGLMVNTTSLEQSDLKLGPDTMKAQYDSASAAAKEARAAKAAEKDVPEQAQEQSAAFTAGADGVTANEAEADEPAFA